MVRIKEGGWDAWSFLSLPRKTKYYSPIYFSGKEAEVEVGKGEGKFWYILH